MLRVDGPHRSSAAADLSSAPCPTRSIDGRDHPTDVVGVPSVGGSGNETTRAYALRPIKHGGQIGHILVLLAAIGKELNERFRHDSSVCPERPTDWRKLVYAMKVGANLAVSLMKHTLAETTFNFMTSPCGDRDRKEGFM